MSAGAFVLAKYEADNGDIQPIRLQPETIAASLGAGTNVEPAGGVTVAAFARSGGGNRKYGVKARSVTLRFGNTAPAGYSPNSTVRIPVLTPAVYNAILGPGVSAEYLGVACTIVGKNPQRGR